jgi:carboxyl-terminal processing protease
MTILLRLRRICDIAVATLIALSIGSMGIIRAEEESAPTRPPAVSDAPAAPDQKADERKDDEAYFELLKVFADTLDQVERNYVQPISRRELMEAAIDGVLSKLDPYSNYIAPKDLDNFRTSVENEFGGIGIRIDMVDGWLTVVTPLIDTPAYKAGVLSGDRILQIDGRSTEGIKIDDAIQIMRGPIGSELKLTVRHRHDGSRKTVTLKRELIHVETVLGHVRNPDNSWDFMLDKTQKIGYIRLTAFSRQTDHDLERALQQLRGLGMQGLVLDLRFNPGGLLSSAVAVADLFLEEGRIVSTSGRNVAEQTWSAKKPGTYVGFDIAVLVNQYSASASEIVAASLQDHKRAVVIGQRTWGKGSVQNIIELDGGRSALKLTTASYVRPSGKNIHRFESSKESDEWGVRPNDNYVVELTPVEIRELIEYQRVQNILNAKEDSASPAPPAIDRQLKRALEHLTQQVAANK